MKFIEFGIGNTWLIRTETELEDGSEYEEKGIKGRIKLKKKDRNEFKFIFGITSST